MLKFVLYELGSLMGFLMARCVSGHEKTHWVPVLPNQCLLAKKQVPFVQGFAHYATNQAV